MFPQIQLFGFISISSFWVFSLLGILVGLHLVLRSVQKQRLDLNVFTEHLILMSITAIIFSRTLRGFYTWEDYSNRGKSFFELFYLVDKEYSIWGAIIGALLIFLPYARKQGEDIGKWLDVFTIPFLIGLSIGNLGLFLEGTRHTGTPTDLPWGIVIDSSQYTVPIHPIPIYTALLALVTAALVNFCRKKWPFWRESGNSFLLGVAFFSLFRFAEEFIIGSAKYLNLFGIYITYYVALLSVIIAITLLVARYRDFKPLP